MKITVRILLCVLASSGSFLSGCSSRRVSGVQKGDEPARIVSLMPSLTEITFALGEGGRLAGVSNYCDYPPQVKDIPKAGDLINVNLERLVLLAPDMILLSSPTQTHLAGELAKSGFRTAMFPDPTDLEGVFTQIQALADTLGVPDKGRMLVDSLKQELASIPAIDSLSLYLEISSDPLMTVDDGSYLTDAFAELGLYNIFSDYSKGYAVISPEKVVIRSPQVIFFLYPDAVKSASGRMGWGDLPAVREGLVFDDLPVDELLRPGPRLIGALKTTSSIIRDAL
ncbi:ABC transporter substrate-binding protein [candidate division WOR-3 bacterium]|uniref:ABC transporter substrate-binding protein n=1 Tax=candidate division WOR-3 bacterium TaxID=2052148 RepID=A0A9D5K9G6_UNCW3|nr:ABC transporter substrate-binding protein [candidate division WOR-3 bacterium]MBD3364075.1 ABC transporter substrate-binding protein [candidate division WOR-3 bacterium]